MLSQWTALCKAPAAHLEHRVHQKGDQRGSKAAAEHDQIHAVLAACLQSGLQHTLCS